MLLGVAVPPTRALDWLVWFSHVSQGNNAPVGLLEELLFFG